MNKAVVLLSLAMLASGCVSLTHHEKRNLAILRANGITTSRPAGYYENPNSQLAAGLWNLLPGIGNVYLATGEGSDSSQWIYGIVNFCLWPVSTLWGVPQAAIDAGTLNKKEMLYYYMYTPEGKRILKQERELELE